MPTLRVQIPGQGEAVHVLTGERISVGRRPDNTIQLLDRSVSAHHAEFILTEGHYRLHDLQSTNLTSVDGNQIDDFHLHASCTISFGNVQCKFDAATQQETAAVRETRLTPAQMDKDVAFLRADNQELLNKIDALQRQIDILSSARLFTGKSEGNSSPDELKRLTAERDELRYHNSGLKLELEKLRDELSTTAKERDQARQAYELLQAQRSSLPEDVNAVDKGSTQKIVFSARG
jgi:hypothetical protein